MLHPVYDERSHQKALRRIEQLWDAAPGTPEAQELDALATLVDTYEKRQFPILPPDPIEAIRARCEQLGYTRKDLEPLIGSRARVSEILGARRALTLPMIRRLHAALGIPAEILLADRCAHRRRSRSAPTRRLAARRSATKRTAKQGAARQRAGKRRGSPAR